MDETYDPKAKKNINNVINKVGITLTIGDRVRYIGSSPCFIGYTGTLKKLKKEWTSARTLSRAGFAGQKPGYSVTALVLWDEATQCGPQCCGPNELAPC